MYPIVRMTKEIVKNLRAERLPYLGTHVSHHICWPWDLDFWMELNNGRVLTLFDLGRVPFSMRIGIAGLLRRKGWAMAIAGVSVRYRRRVRMFHRVEMHTRCVGWDDRFIYLDQTMWRRGECTAQALYRAVITDKNGIVAPVQVPEAMGLDRQSPPLPAWVTNWIDAEATRPWPPERGPGNTPDTAVATSPG